MRNGQMDRQLLGRESGRHTDRQERHLPPEIFILWDCARIGCGMGLSELPFPLRSCSRRVPMRDQ